MGYILKLLKLIGIPTQKMIAPFLTKHLGSFLRHALSGVGFWLIANGIADEETTKIFLGASYDVLLGLAAYLVAQGFSLLEKKKRD